MNFSKQHIVVIGGSSGIGFAIAAAALQQGSEITIVGRSVEKLEQAKAMLREDVVTEAVDINDEAAVKTFFSAVEPIDHLIITAATIRGGAFSSLPVETAKHIFTNKFWGSYIAAKYALPHLTKTASILFVSGMVAHKPVAELSAVAAACSAIEGLTKSLAKELAPIRVNAISPGFIATPLLGDDAATKYKDFTDTLLVKRIGEPNEAALAAIYLMQNAYISGEILNVNGGALLV